jgi:hypothetical protein
VSFDTICLLVGWLVGRVCRLGPLFPSVHPNLGSTARLA